MPGRTLFLIVPFQLFPQPCRCLFFTPAHFPHWRQDVLEVFFFKVHVFRFPALHRLPKFCHHCLRATPISVERTDMFPKSAAQTLLRLKTFVLCSTCFVISSISSSFLLRKASRLSPSLSLSLSCFFFICSCTFKHCIQVSFSFRTLLAVLGPRDSLFLHECIERFTFCTNLFPLSFWFRVLPGVYRALSPAASRRLLLPGFRGAIPPSVFQFVIFVCNGTIQNCSCLIKIGKSLSFVG